jgi:hypothetical protein
MGHYARIERLNFYGSSVPSERPAFAQAVAAARVNMDEGEWEGLFFQSLTRALSIDLVLIVPIYH